MKKFYYIFLLLSLSISATARERRIEHRMVVDIPFVLAGGEEKDIRYDIDSVTLSKSLLNLQHLANDSTVTIKSIEFYSSVSPEGTVRFNKQLGKIRLATAERIICNRLDHIDKSVIIGLCNQEPHNFGYRGEWFLLHSNVRFDS